MVLLITKYLQTNTVVHRNLRIPTMCSVYQCQVIHLGHEEIRHLRGLKSSMISKGFSSHLNDNFTREGFIYGQTVEMLIFRNAQKGKLSFERKDLS